jgi:transcriptional regulator with XRE-family HTH domain
MSPADYQRERLARGTQESVAEKLGVHAQTIAKRERGAPDAPITREAWLALLSLPKKRKRRSGPSNDQSSATRTNDAGRSP